MMSGAHRKSTMPISFSLRAIEAETADKVSSMVQYSDALEDNLLYLCGKRFSAADVKRIEQTIFFGKSLESKDRNHPSMRVYFSHPVRVATLALRLESEACMETVETGLLHNVFEVSGLQENDLLRASYSDRMVRGIRLLTIDRQHQYDPDYLAGFYSEIEAFGEDLALIKCVDKLDNLLAFELFERTQAIEMYLDMCERFVVPMAQRLSDELSDYFREVIAYMRASSCKQDLRAQYEFFLRQATESAAQSRGL
jgi:(p)ppGpp synthase/HD superfamily hydrolase